ncbi:partial histidinol-phosphate aminotransferase, partial [biofilm metagenome]
ANPNNPTGTLLNQADLGRFINAMPTHCLCVLDEAYFEYVEDHQGINSIDWLTTHPNLIITRTFSKAYGLAGLRVGYSLSSPEIADILNRVRQPFNNNVLALAAAEAALSDDDYLQKTITVNSQGMSDLINGFKDLGLEWIPSAGNFVSVDLKRPGQAVYEALLRKGVIVRPVANYGMPNHLRISIGTKTENLLFLKALAEIVGYV